MRDKKSSLRQQVTPLLGSPAASQHQAEKARGPLTLCHHCKKKASEHETVTIGPTRAFCKTCFVCEECQKTLEPGRFVEMASGLYCREHDGSSYLAYGTDASTTTPNEDPQWKGRLSVSQSYDSVLCEASTSVCSFAMVPEAVGGSSGGVGGVGGVGRSPIGVDDGVAGGGGSGESGGGQAAAEAAAAAGAASEGEGRADGDESGGGGGGGGGGATTEISSSRFFRPPAPIEIDERTRAAAATRTAAAAATTTAGQPFGRGCDISSSSSRDGGGGVLGRSVGTSDTIEDGMDLEIPPFRCTPSESGSPSHNLTGGRELVESAESLGALSPTLEMTEKEPPDISTGKVASPFSTNASETETPIRQLEKLVADVVKDGEELSKLYENIASDPAKKFSSNIVSLIVTAVVNGAKRVVEAASSIIDVSGLESLLQYIERENSERADQSTCGMDGNRKEYFKKTVCSVITAVTDLLAEFRQAESNIIVKLSNGYCVEAASHLRQPISYEGYVLEHVEPDSKHYRKNFVGKDHTTLIGISETLGPVVISLRRESELDDSSEESTAPADEFGPSRSAFDDSARPFSLTQSPSTTEYYRHHAILRTKDKPDVRVIIHESDAQRKSALLNLRGKGNMKAILECLHPDLHKSKIKRVQDRKIEKCITELDEIKSSTSLKVGVLLCKEGQTREEEFFSNEHGSARFDKFLEVLGNRVELQGYTGFLGGLDGKNGCTGSHSVSTTWRDFELMYHVSTLLPFAKDDEQQIQRKRHIGNDIVCILFLDGDMQFDPSSIRSQFLHVFIAVQPRSTSTGEDAYKVNVTSSSDVPKFGPPLPYPPIFYDKFQLRDFLMAKIVNAEHAALKAPKFLRPHRRTRDAMIDSIISEFRDSSNSDAPPNPQNNSGPSSAVAGASNTTATTSHDKQHSTRTSTHALHQASFSPTSGRLSPSPASSPSLGSPDNDARSPTTPGGGGIEHFEAIPLARAPSGGLRLSNGGNGGASRGQKPAGGRLGSTSRRRSSSANDASKRVGERGPLPAEDAFGMPADVTTLPLRVSLGSAEAGAAAVSGAPGGGGGGGASAEERPLLVTSGNVGNVGMLGRSITAVLNRKRSTVRVDSSAGFANSSATAIPSGKVGDAVLGPTPLEDAATTELDANAMEIAAGGEGEPGFDAQIPKGSRFSFFRRSSNFPKRKE